MCQYYKSTYCHCQYFFSTGESAAEGDLNDNYEDIEAKLQQERIEYLQTLRKRSELSYILML